MEKRFIFAHDFQGFFQLLLNPVAALYIMVKSKDHGLVVCSHIHCQSRERVGISEEENIFYKVYMQRDSCLLQVSTS